jgi:hypothetical protein
LPANTLTFPSAPGGAGINGPAPSVGRRPRQVPALHVHGKVADNGRWLSDEEEITVTVKEVNKAPVPDPIAPKEVDEETLIGSRRRRPIRTFRPIRPPGRSPVATGWLTPDRCVHVDLDQPGPGVYNVTLRATDNGTPPLGGDVIVQITVKEVNLPRCWARSATRTWMRKRRSPTATTDPDLPPNSLTFSLIGAGGCLHRSNDRRLQLDAD